MLVHLAHGDLRGIGADVNIQQSIAVIVHGGSRRDEIALPLAEELVGSVSELAPVVDHVHAGLEAATQEAIHVPIVVEVREERAVGESLAM